METPDSIFKKAIQVYGCLNQSDMMIEESAELIQAINKLKRVGGISHGEIRKPTKEDHHDYSLAYHDLCGEVADVKILLHQMERMLDKATVELIVERKVLRLNERLNRANNNNKGNNGNS